MRHRLLTAAALAIACQAVVSAVPAHADFRLERRLPLAPGGTLVVDVAGGDVTVTGAGNDGAVVVITSDRDDIDRRYTFALTSAPGRASLVSRRRGSDWFGWLLWNGNRLHYDVRVPRATSVDLKSSGGGVRLAGVDGRAQVRSSGGGLTIADITGAVDADSSGGGVVVRRVHGALQLRSSGGHVEAHEIIGDVVASSSGGHVEVSQVTGNVEASSSGGGVRLDSIGGHIAAESSGGSVAAVLAAGNSAGGSLSSSGGGVRVDIAPDARISIDAHSSGGSVNCALPVTRHGDESRSTLRGDLNGGGPMLRLRSSGGGIRIGASGGR